MQILSLPKELYRELFRYLDYHAVDRLSMSCARFAVIVNEHLPELARREVCEIQVFAYGYYDDAQAIGCYNISPSKVSPIGESPALDVVITERRQRVISNNLWRKRRTCFRGDLATVMPGIRAYLRHADIRVLSLHGIEATREIANQFASIASVRDRCTEIKIAESTLCDGALVEFVQSMNGLKVWFVFSLVSVPKEYFQRLTLDGFIRGLHDLNNDFMVLCVRRGVQELKLHVASDDLRSTVTHEGYLKFCFGEGPAETIRRRRLYVSDDMLAVITDRFVPKFIKVKQLCLQLH